MRESLLSPVFLMQTDTTVGLLSKNDKRLREIKNREDKKPFLKNVSSFKELKSFTRAPQKFKTFIRRAKRATFVYPNKEAIRVIGEEEGEIRGFLKRYGWHFSTSANRSGENFDFNYIKDKVDIIIYTPNGFKESTPSSLYRVGSRKIRRLR